MRVLVFGGSGFLGSHVADVLSDAGHDVTIYDLKKAQFFNKNHKFIKGDILDEKLVKDAVKSCEVVYNFAGIADMDDAKKFPVETIKNNILGNTFILDACAKSKVKRFVFASSIYVYSDRGSFYRSSKQACELIIENYNHVCGLNYNILRYGSLYGPRANENNGLNIILTQAIRENKIVRHGDGEEIREYVHVFDAARCSVDILDDKYVNQHIVITGNQQMKVKDLLIMIKEIMDNKIKIEYMPVDDNIRPHDLSVHYEITPYVFNPKLAKRITNSHYVDLGQGIIELLKEKYKDHVLSNE
ncbi:NAD-dependent epimerase/dehydratase family protein [Candidatus Omnitrophota bacterium]